jgi:peptidyl-prolyl cis-trans isomerase SurA
MNARAVVVTAVGIAVGGCSAIQARIPAWVPYFGTDRVAKPPVARPHDPTTQPLPPPARAKVDDDVADRVVAVVNNDAITLGELQESIAVVRQESHGSLNKSEDELLREFLSRLIETRLQLQEADRDKVTIEDAEVNEELEARMKRFGAKDVQELEKMIKAQGLTMDAVRRRVRDTLRVNKVVRRKVALRVSVTEAEVDRYIAENREKLEAGLQYHARHILIVPEGGSDAAWESARIRADMIRQQILDGGDFGALAQQYSKDASAKDGGDLGTLRRGELSQDIEEQILKLGPGEISRPYRSSLGYHLFRLESKETLEGESLERVKQQVRDILFREKYEARLKAWLKEIRDRAIIEVRL